MNDKKNSGQLWLDDNVIHYTCPSMEPWALPLSDLRILGEFTNGEGPFLVDYFFVFITGLNESYGASFYSEGRDEFLKELGKKLDVAFECKLVGSTEFASNVLWPKDLAGQPLYEFTEKPTKGTVKTILRWLGFGKMNVCYSHHVLAKLQ